MQAIVVHATCEADPDADATMLDTSTRTLGIARNFKWAYNACITSLHQANPLTNVTQNTACP